MSLCRVGKVTPMEGGGNVSKIIGAILNYILPIPTPILFINCRQLVLN